jgi:large subunit ribosomal protein L7/L12
MSEESSKFNVVLIKSGRDKVEMMKVVMALTGWGLKQSKDLIDHPPGIVLKRVSREKADSAKSQLETAGATVEIRPAG